MKLMTHKIFDKFTKFFHRLILAFFHQENTGKCGLHYLYKVKKGNDEHPKPVKCTSKTVELRSPWKEGLRNTKDYHLSVLCDRLVTLYEEQIQLIFLHAFFLNCLPYQSYYIKLPTLNSPTMEKYICAYIVKNVKMAEIANFLHHHRLYESIRKEA